MREQALLAGYEGAAGWWAGALQRLGYDRAYQGLLRRVQPGARRVCDIGTGAGDLALAYLQAVGRPVEMVLVDPSPAMLSVARRRVGRARAVLARLQDFTDPTGFDLVLAGHVMEHCADPCLALRQLAALLRPGGRLVMVISRPHWCQLLIWLRWRHRWFAPERVLRFAEAAGLVCDSAWPFDYGPPRRLSLGYVFHKPEGELR